jgi:DNA-binding MarR family transcriptional regulator
MARTPHPEPAASRAARNEAYATWPTSELALALYDVLHLSGDTRTAMARRLGLNPSEVDAMEHLMDEPMGPVELSRRLHMTSASATVLVDRLEEAGHVSREADPEDRRRRVVRPTQQGVVSVYAQVAPLVTDLVAAEDQLSASQRAAVLRYLERVAEVLTAHAGSDPS